MAKENLKTDHEEASTLFHLAKRQVLNRTQEAPAVNELAKSIAKIKKGYANTLKSNFTKTVTKIKKNGNTEIINYREKILATIEDVKLKKEIEEISYPKLQ